MNTHMEYVIIISADAEWRVTKEIVPPNSLKKSPYGEWYAFRFHDRPEVKQPVIFMHGGWGKVAAAGSAQYVIDRWNPRLIVNLGTCGGFEGEIRRGEIVLVEKAIIYDIFEQMGDPEEHLRHYMTQIDTSWLEQSLPLNAIRTVLVSGDRDLFSNDVPSLKSKYGAIAGDWESGAIAWVASKNKTHCLILRGVTDLVGESGGEAYEGKVNYYYENTGKVMKQLIESLPDWLLQYQNYFAR